MDLVAPVEKPGPFLFFESQNILIPNKSKQDSTRELQNRSLMSGFARVWTSTWSRGKLKEIEVQVLVRPGLPRFDIIGLPENVIKEGKDRILSALHFLGIQLKSQKILISLNPAGEPKEGAHFDLAILAGILRAMGQLPVNENYQDFYWGELTLEGRIQKLASAPAHLFFASQNNHARLFANQEAISWLDCELFRCESVSDLFDSKHYSKEKPVKPVHRPSETWLNERTENSRWNQLMGLPSQFLLFALCAIGRLHLLLEGPPGVGKSSWCIAFREILPPLSKEEWAERLRSAPLSEIQQAFSVPFEAPHHSTSAQAIIGGGSKKIDAGAISRAHKGILFLDEIPEFPRNIREALREPLENKRIHIFRNGMNMEFLADFQLIATMNPCPCGFHESKTLCRCSARSLEDYRARMSGPLLDRIHWHSWWEFHREEIPKEFRLESLRPKILEARQVSVSLSNNLAIPNFSNPRRTKKFREIFTSWCQWHGLEHPSQKHLEEFFQFYESHQAQKQKERLSSPDSPTAFFGSGG